MIINLLLNLILLIFTGLFSFFPEVNLASIPIIGETARSALISAVTTWNGFLVTFPYSIIVWKILIYAVLPFEGLLLLLKFFLGHRAPVNSYH